MNHWGYFIYLNWMPTYFYRVLGEPSCILLFCQLRSVVLLAAFRVAARPRACLAHQLQTAANGASALLAPMGLPRLTAC